MDCRPDMRSEMSHAFISRRIPSPELTTEALPGNALLFPYLLGLVAAIGEPDIEVKSQWRAVDERVRERPEI